VANSNRLASGSKLPVPPYGMSMSSPAPFSDRLAAAIDKRGTVACVGLDPVIEKFPRDMQPATAADHGAAATAIRRFCDAVIDAVHEHVPVVKFQSACFERYGEHGIAALRQSILHASQAGLIVILDAKRGDIGISAEHYAAAAFEGSAPADALTCSGYLGPDTIEPLLKPGRGVFILVRTSNPGSDAVQSAKLADGRTVAESMADLVATLGQSRRGRQGLSDVGAVVGATKSVEAKALRQRMPDTIFLIPGYGAQGGTIEDIRPALRPRRTPNAPASLGVLVTASRSVIYPGGPDSASWKRNVAGAARKLAADLRAL